MSSLYMNVLVYYISIVLQGLPLNLDVDELSVPGT